MLVRDPEKRYSIEMIKKHRWVVAGDALKPIVSQLTIPTSNNHTDDVYDELVLRLMDQLGLERQKTIEVNSFTELLLLVVYILW